MPFHKPFNSLPFSGEAKEPQTLSPLFFCGIEAGSGIECFPESSEYRVLSIRISKNIGLLVLALPVFAAGAVRLTVNPQDYRARALRAGAPPRIDGRLDDPAWAEAAGAGGFIQREPEEGRPATERTEVRILYDDETIYFGVRCFDREAGRIVANEMRRDAELESNDTFEILLDTYHDSRNAFLFATNPLGCQVDALIRDEGANINKNWDGIWTCRTTRDAQGWTAEIAIPFYTLRFGPDPRPVWGLNFGRRIARKKEEDFWVPILRDYGFMGAYRVSFYGHLDGLEGIRQGKSLQVMPYVLGGRPRKTAATPSSGPPPSAWTSRPA